MVKGGIRKTAQELYLEAKNSELRKELDVLKQQLRSLSARLEDLESRDGSPHREGKKVVEPKGA